MSDALYRAEILEHYRNPQDFGTLKSPTASTTRLNPLCGDEITIQIKLRSKRFTDIAFCGSGCALSIASASFFAEFLKGKSLTFIKKIQPQDALKIFGVKVVPARKKCVLLPFDALQELLKTSHVNEQKASTRKNRRNP